jgi:rod shape-determining protein MreC
MESFLGRYRNLVILVGVLFLQVLGLATQVRGKGNDAEKTRLIRIWVVGAITPFERAVVWVENSTTGLWHNYFYLRGVRAENRDLKAQIENMRLEQVRLSEDAAQARRLQGLLAFKEQFISRTVAAQVIGSSGTDLSVYIDKGENAGLKRDMAVITADGIVGKVLLVYPSVSQVLLINDPTSGVGALLEKTRLQGVLHGTPGGEVVLERVMSDEQVPVGETVLTSGGDQIFPKGLPIGTVTKVGNGKDLFLNIKVKPAANLSKLEEVLVLVEKQERQATAEDSGRVRAADILALRLPSVPDKPATEAKPEGAAEEGSKPASPRSTPKRLGAPPTGTTAASQGAKNPTVTNEAHSVPVAGQPAKAASLNPAVQKSAVVSDGTTPATKPAVPQTGPANPAPSSSKPASPQASAPQTNTQAPADENGPH